LSVLALRLHARCGALPKTLTEPVTVRHEDHGREELENVALESTRTIEIDEFVDRSEIDPRYLIRPYYLRRDGKVGHDAFAVIRETIREMNKVAIGRVVLTSREHIIALEPLDRGLIGTLLRYPYEVRSADEYFDDIQDVKVTKDMLNLAEHIVNQKAGHFEPDKFEDQYETAMIDLINQKRAGKPITAKERPRGENVVDQEDPSLPPLHFQHARPVFESVGHIDHGRRELALLAHQHETLAASQRKRRAENESARLDARHGIDRAPFRLREQAVERLDGGGEVALEKRRDIAEQDSRFREILHIADRRLELLRRPRGHDV